MLNPNQFGWDEVKSPVSMSIAGKDVHSHRLDEHGDYNGTTTRGFVTHEAGQRYGATAVVDSHNMPDALSSSAGPFRTPRRAQVAADVLSNRLHARNRI